VGVVSGGSEIAAGLLLADERWPDRITATAQATDELRRRLHPSTVWQSGYLPPDLRGRVAYGQELPRWRAPDDMTPEEEQALEAAWSAALPPLDRGMRRYLRVRVDSPADVRRLRTIGEVDGLMIVPSLDSRGWTRGGWWRWPFRVGVGPGPLADEWLATVRQTSHYGNVFDAELFDATQTYDIAIVSATELSSLPADVARRLGDAACVIVAGDGPVEQQLMELEGRIEPMISISVAGSPEAWWRAFFHEMSHDVPIDAAVESIVRFVDVDALVAGPSYGMDITASAHWFAAVAPDFPQLAPLLDEFAGWDWRYESGGTTTETRQVREVHMQGLDPAAFIPLPEVPEFEEVPEFREGPEFPERPELPDRLEPGGEKEEELEEEAPAAEPSKPRRLVARVLDGDTLVKSILPPQRDLNFAVRIAIPERGDIAADKPAPALPAAAGPTVELEVVVRGDVWAQQPAPQKISISREKRFQPSTWAVFPLTTPESGGLVSIEVLVLYQGKPLQAATYVSSVRAAAVPGERPTLTTFAMSGPDEPSDELRPVDATLDGTGAELQHWRSTGGKVLITDVQAMLDKIEDRISRVLGVRGAPDSFDDERALELLISLANIGVELGTSLAPLDLGDARSINVIVNPTTRVLPLELVYAGPAPEKSARLCPHVAKLPPSRRLEPPPAGQVCTKASSRRVCPYAFWGLHRSIARTIQSAPTRGGKRKPPSPTLSASSVLYAATVIADDGATTPLPSASVFEAAKQAFKPATRVTSWTAWRRAVKADKPNLLVLLGHMMVEGGETNLYIGKNSAIARARITDALLRADGSPPPLVLLIACATAALGDPFGSLPGTMTAKGAGAVVGTLSKIIGPHGAAATMHLLRALHDLTGQDASVGDSVAAARRSLVAERRPIGLILVSHGEMDTKVGV
jgi:hypothetical protein